MNYWDMIKTKNMFYTTNKCFESVSKYLPVRDKSPKAYSGIKEHGDIDFAGAHINPKGGIKYSGYRTKMDHVKRAPVLTTNRLFQSAAGFLAYFNHNAHRMKFEGKKKEEVMKKILVLMAIAMVVIGMAGSASAATETGNVTINANVGTNCTAIAPNNLLITITGPGEMDSSGGNTTVQCTNATSHAVTASSSNNGGVPGPSPLSGLLRSVGHPDIAYNLYFKDPVTGLGFGGIAYDAVIINGTGAAGLTGAVVMASGTEEAASYSDTVTLTLTY